MMSRLEKSITLATNLAVLIGLALVVFELRQNRESILITHQVELAQAMSEVQLSVVTTPGLAELIVRADEPDPSFSDAEQRILLNYLLARMEIPVSYYHLRDSDFVILEDWCNLMRWFSYFYSHPYFGEQVRFSINYAEDVEASIRDRCQ